MIKKLLFFILMFISIGAFAQQDGDSRYSFGVRGYNYMQMPKVLNQSNDHSYLSTYFTSYIIKFNDNLFSYRLNGGYLNESMQFNNNCGTCELVDGKVKDYYFKVGFEKNLTYSAFQPYFALDLGYRNNKFEGTSTAAGSASSPVTAIKEGFTITPVFGIKISPVKYISIFAESNLEFFYAYERQETMSQDADNTRNVARFRKAEYLLNPVSVGVQFHIGHKN